MIRLYNSKTLAVEEFKPIKDGEVSMYVCGPTVYNYAHIGNARPMVVFDVLKRLFEAEGYHVTYVSMVRDLVQRDSPLLPPRVYGALLVPLGPCVHVRHQQHVRLYGSEVALPSSSEKTTPVIKQVTEKS